MTTESAETLIHEAPEPPLASAAAASDDKPVIPPAGDVVKPAPVPQVPEAAVNQTSKGSLDRDVALAKLEDEKRLSFVKAWEESEKSKVENKAQKKVSEIASWENTKKAALEAELRKIEERMEKKRADYAERVKNKLALIHKQAEEKRASIEAIRGQEVLEAEEKAVKYRATGYTPKKSFGCF